MREGQRSGSQWDNKINTERTKARGREHLSHARPRRTSQDAGGVELRKKTRTKRVH